MHHVDLGWMRPTNAAISPRISRLRRTTRPARPAEIWQAMEQLVASGQMRAWARAALPPGTSSRQEKAAARLSAWSPAEPYSLAKRHVEPR